MQTLDDLLRVPSSDPLLRNASLSNPTAGGANPEASGAAAANDSFPGANGFENHLGGFNVPGNGNETIELDDLAQMFINGQIKMNETNNADSNATTTQK